MKATVVSFLLLPAVLLWFPAIVPAAENPLRPTWRSLTFELPPAFTVTAEIEDIDAGAAPLIQRPRALAPRMPRLIHLKVATRLQWFLSTKTWLGDLWLQPDWRALQRNRLKSGRSRNLKIYRYAEHGVYRLRYRPRDGTDAPPSQWPLTSEQFHPYSPKVVRRCGMISDPYALLIQLSRKQIPGTPLCLFNKHSVYEIRLQREGVQSFAADFQRDGERIQGRIEAERWRILPTPLEPERNPEAFEFLGMEGVIEVLRDPATHLPLQLHGYVEALPQARLRLTRVRTR
ncbi:hypothetical protein MIN45_P1123 [Methylomarinovum tepidoasis]|uniref:DUF3108 domain-containing protein n=1 Tax=Methylomarinovum tepidoasis TaxID=2840183 RepID=A0AAU9CX72_9GAMM|nr:hypothetical protein [Methylomarinovum sp. IN45]BCX88754.1 hypothetical protein MIN45_P1123 [Methylomarinovum sp. IN45]